MDALDIIKKIFSPLFLYGTVIRNITTVSLFGNHESYERGTLGVRIFGVNYAAFAKGRVHITFSGNTNDARIGTNNVTLAAMPSLRVTVDFTNKKVICGAKEFPDTVDIYVFAVDNSYWMGKQSIFMSIDANEVFPNKYLLKDNEGYKNLIELVSTSFPTEDQFKEKGMSEIPSFDQLSSFNKLITYTTNNLSKSLIKFKPKEKTIVSSGDINLTGKNLKKVSLTGTENIKILFSKDDGNNWYNKTTGKIPIVNATSNSTHWSGDAPNKAIDEDKNTIWQVFGQPIPTGQTGHELVLDLGKNMVLNNACIITCNVGSMGSMGVKNFEVYGANASAIKQELLYSGIASNSFDSATKETLFMINGEKAYRYCIFNFKESYSGLDVIVNEIELYGELTPTLISDISIQGLTPTQLSAMTPQEWKDFMGDSNTLRFAYYLPDETANTDKLELTLDYRTEYHYKINPLSCYYNQNIEIRDIAIGAGYSLVFTMGDDRLSVNQNENKIVLKYSDLEMYREIYLQICNDKHEIMYEAVLPIRKEVLYRTELARTFKDNEAGYTIKNVLQDNKTGVVI